MSRRICLYELDARYIFDFHIIKYKSRCTQCNTESYKRIVVSSWVTLTIVLRAFFSNGQSAAIKYKTVGPAS